MRSVLRARPVVGSRHLEGMLSAYADRSLPAATLLACDQHVSICPGCGAAAGAERRLLTSLRTAATPVLPSRLESALLDLAVHAAPPVLTNGPSQLAVMHRSAPAMYRSPVRAAMLASLAAGASAAAAWSLGVGGLGASGASLPVVRLPSAAVTAASTIGNASGGQSASSLSLNQVAGFAATTGLTTTGLTTTGAAAPGRTAPVPAAGAVPRPPRVPDLGRRSAQSIHD